jgi:hypothetical protein
MFEQSKTVLALENLNKITYYKYESPGELINEQDKVKVTPGPKKQPMKTSKGHGDDVRHINTFNRMEDILNITQSGINTVINIQEKKISAEA